jgi:hypothetical protein
MLSSPDTGLDSFVAAAVIIVLLIFLVTLFIIAKSVARKPDENHSRSLQSELAEIKQRVACLEAQINSRASTVGDDAPEDPLYSIALRLIKAGLPFDEIAARVGISRAEVELIQVLNRESGRIQ